MLSRVYWWDVRQEPPRLCRQVRGIRPSFQASYHHIGDGGSFVQMNCYPVLPRGGPAPPEPWWGSEVMVVVTARNTGNFLNLVPIWCREGAPRYAPEEETDPTDESPAGLRASFVAETRCLGLPLFSLRPSRGQMQGPGESSPGGPGRRRLPGLWDEAPAGAVGVVSRSPASLPTGLRAPGPVPR